jgi:hypothetical protein
VSRGLGRQQVAAIGALERYHRLPVRRLSGILDLSERRCREVLRSLHQRGAIDLTREQIATQETSGRPVHGLVAWSGRAAFRRDSDRRWREHYDALMTEHVRFVTEYERAMSVPRCPCCRQELLTVPSGRKLADGSFLGRSVESSAPDRHD